MACINNSSLPHLSHFKEHEEFFENKKINKIFVRKLILEKKNNKEFSGDYFLFENIRIQCKVVEGFKLQAQQIEVPYVNHNIFLAGRYVWEDLTIKISVEDYNDLNYEKIMSIKDFSIEIFSNEGSMLQKWNGSGFLTNIEFRYEIYLTFRINHATLTF
jgi:hypothetical protein